MLVFEGIHAQRCAYEYISCLLLCINPAGEYKIHGEQERALDTASLGWMVEGLINVHGVVRLQKRVCTFTNKVQSDQLKRRKETWLSIVMFYTSSDSVLCGC